MQVAATAAPIGLARDIDCVKSVVKYFGSTRELPLKLACSREVEVHGTSGGAVKCVDIGRNTCGESGALDLF